MTVNRIINESDGLSAIPYQIAEFPPFYLSFERIDTSDKTRFKARIGKSSAYTNELFARLLQTVSTIASCCLSEYMAKAEVLYFLSEKARVSRISPVIKEGDLYVEVRPVFVSEIRTKAIADVTDESGDVIYQFELNCRIFTTEVFQKLFKSHYNPNAGIIKYEDRLPDLKAEKIHEMAFSITIEPFSINHCAGHFYHYPVVAVVFVLECLIKAIKEWVGVKYRRVDADLMIDQLQLFLNWAMPVNAIIYAQAEVSRPLPNILLFVIRVNDQADTEYGTYVISIQL